MPGIYHQSVILSASRPQLLRPDQAQPTYRVPSSPPRRHFGALRYLGPFLRLYKLMPLGSHFPGSPSAEGVLSLPAPLIARGRPGKSGCKDECDHFPGTTIPRPPAILGYRLLIPSSYRPPARVLALPSPSERAVRRGTLC